MKAVFSLLVASALSAQVWTCSQFGVKGDEDYDMSERTTVVTVKGATATVKIKGGEVFSYIKQASRLDGIVIYKMKSEPSFLTASSGENGQFFVALQNETMFLIDSCVEGRE